MYADGGWSQTVVLDMDPLLPEIFVSRGYKNGLIGEGWEFGLE